jgi:site-specific DNA-methyltransferase (adenine-specific)
MLITNEDNMKLMGRYEDNHFDLAIVDPPYGIGIDGQKKSKKTQIRKQTSLKVGIMQTPSE